MSGAAAGEHYDELETRDPAAREAALLTALPGQIAHAKANAPHYARLFAEFDPAAVTSRAALARLPVTRKSALIALQSAAPPWGGLAAVRSAGLARLFMSPGPVYEPQGRGADYWRLARALFAAGFRAGDVVHNSFSYHLTPGGAMLEAGALALGCAVVPAGTGQTELQLRAIADLSPAGYVGTPSFLRILLAKARDSGGDVSSLKRALVSGEAFPPALQQEFAAAGIAAYQCYATAELGLIAYESRARRGLVLDERIIVELVRPGTGDPVPEGEVGEVVATVLAPEYPLVRFATGDLSAFLPAGASPCGRTNRRLKGWLGRADQTTKVKGMFVHPEQLAELARHHPEVARYRLVVDRVAGADAMVLRAEAAAADPGLAARLADGLTALTKLGGTIELVPPGSLPGDGIVIEDRRKP